MGKPNESLHEHDSALPLHGPLSVPMPDEAIFSASGAPPSATLPPRRNWVCFILVKFSCGGVTGYHVFSQDAPVERELPPGTDRFNWRFVCPSCEAEHACNIQWR